MIHPIAPPPYAKFGPSSWWDMLVPSSPVYWFVIAAIVLAVGYAAWVIYAAIQARNADPCASFVSLACFDRMMANSQGDGTRHFLVQTHKGFPNIEQFEHVLPDDESSFRVSYRNEVHGYTFRLIKRPEGSYDVFILKAPRYDGRPSDEASSFRAGIGTSRERIAFAPGMEPVDLPDCVRKAIFWAEANSRYIVTGMRWVKQGPAPQGHAPGGRIRSASGTTVLNTR